MRKKLCNHLLAGGVLCAVGLGAYSCTDRYDLDSEQPSGLTSIYGYMLDRPEYSTFKHLIDDLGQKDVMSRTGSNTLFVANNDAFKKFYEKNDWNVHSYDDLSQTQKKQLLYSAMVGNPFTTSMLATATGPIKGEVMRRITGLEIIDSVDVYHPSDPAIPQTKQWEMLREGSDSIVLFRDDTQIPTVHFTAKFMQSNGITSDDVDFLYNQPAGTRAADDAYIGSATIITPNQFALNGFVHEINKVLTPLDNMAEIIRKNASNPDQTKSTAMFSRILERFAAPDLVTDETLKRQYNEKNGTTYSDIYIKRYASRRSKGSDTQKAVAFEGGKVGELPAYSEVELLDFDPGWNSYVSSTFNDRNPLMEEMAVMLVPTDAAFKKWWNEGNGSKLRDEYQKIYPNTDANGDLLDSIPLNVFQPLVNNLMFENLTTTLPHNFEAKTVKDEAQYPLEINVSNVDSVILGCNGAVYLTDQVFTPAKYRTVLYPTVVKEEALKTINAAISYLNYDAYLNADPGKSDTDPSKDGYSLLLPVNEVEEWSEGVSGFSYIDPVTYQFTGQQKLWHYYFDEKSTKSEYNIKAEVYSYTLGSDRDPRTGTVWTELSWKKDDGTINYDNPLVNRMVDILDNMIILGQFETGKQYYKTKGGNFVRIVGEPSTPTSLKVYGSLQDELGDEYGLEVIDDFKQDNGRTYLIRGGVPTGTRLSVLDALSQRKECSEFYNLLKVCAQQTGAMNSEYPGSISKTGGNLVVKYDKGDLGNEQGDAIKYVTLLNSYNYTIYAPSNEAMQKAYSWGLPSANDINNATDKKVMQQMKAVALDFIKYHIQDNSVYVDCNVSPHEGKAYETANIALNPVKNKKEEIVSWTTGRPYKIIISTCSKNGMTLKDAQLKANEDSIAAGKEGDFYLYDDIKVLNTVGQESNLPLYNIQAREYWFDAFTNSNNYKKDACPKITSTSNAVIHVIDRPLVYNVPFNSDGTVNLDKPSQFKYVYRSLVAPEEEEEDAEEGGEDATEEETEEAKTRRK